LPTEAEWQHAARSSSELLGSKEALEALQQEWLCARPRGERGKGEVSNWGLYDMTGEFSEWSTDAWRQVYQLGAPEPLLDPVEDDPDAGFHTLRGEFPRDQYIRRGNYINYRVPGKSYLHHFRDWSLKYNAYFRVVRGTRGLNAPWPSGASEAPELA
jgi:formylglycine-generating enzyme required for sulfatase activity